MSKDFKKSFYNLHTRFLTFLLNRPQYIWYTKSPIEQSLSMNFNTNDEEIINLNIYILQRKCAIQAFLKKKTHVIRVKWKNGKTDMLSPNLKSNNSSWSYLYQGRYNLTGVEEKNYWMNAYYSDIEYQEYQVYLFAKDHYDVSWNKKVVERLYLGRMYPRGWVHGRSIAHHHRKPPRRPTRMMIKTARQIMIMIFFCK